MQPINPILPELYDYNSYKEKINDYFNSTMDDLGRVSHGIDKSRPRKIFWAIVNGTWQGEDDIYVRITFHVAYEINNYILAETGQIAPFYQELLKSWFTYLRER